MICAAFFASMELMDTIEIVKQYGPFCGTLLLAVIFFIWRDWKREDKLTRRIDKLEGETRNELIALLKDCTSVIIRNTQVMEQNAKVMERLQIKLES